MSLLPARRTAMLLLFVLVPLLAGCQARRAKFDIIVSPTASGSQFRVMTVIAGGEDQFDLKIIERVRAALRDQGLTVVQRGGRWDSEHSAVRALCGETSTGEGLDGVVFVMWNALTLRDCASGEAVYQIYSTEAGVDELTRRLVLYLGSRQEPPSGSH